MRGNRFLEANRTLKTISVKCKRIHYNIHKNGLSSHKGPIRKILYSLIRCYLLLVSMYLQNVTDPIYYDVTTFPGELIE